MTGRSPAVVVAARWPPATGLVMAAPGERTLDETYRTLAPALLGYFRSHGAPDPEDLVGEVFVGVARGLRRFRGDDDALRRWVFTIAYRRLVDNVRRRAARPYHPVAHLPEPQTHDQPTALDVDLVRALGELTALQREVVLLRFVADLPLADVARILRRRVGAVKTLQSRALDQLARSLGSP
ncbi:MAG: RNA polymerase sigma factor [Acidimicrobiales bacterium]